MTSYEEILRNRNSPERRERMKPVLDRIPEHWGKSLPDPGWDDILLDLDRDLARLDPDYQIHQAKEKWGELRFYIQFSDRLISIEGSETRDAGYQLINAAEEKSGTTCEACGAEGRRRSGGWIKTLCDEHARDEGKA